MALVGTISGSNGTTTSAVSGSLIIANQPPGSFPSLPAGFNFFVSGARAPDAGSASALFGGDVFMSGALTLVGSFTATGSIKALSGFSGSLTKLTDGTDYLIAGSNITLTTGSSGAVTVANTSIPTLGAIYGGGADGAFDLDGTNTYAAYFSKAGSQYTALVDVKATTIRVRRGSICLPSQFWLYAETSFTVDTGGIVRNNGLSATGGAQGAAIAAAGTIQTATFAGAAGRSTSGVGTNGGSGSNHVGGAGGAGGAGGGNGGGGGGSVSLPAATAQGIGTPFFRQTHRVLAPSTPTVVSGGCGGGTGGATLNTGTATSGAGGGGASAIRVNARAFTNAGTVSCNGGNGGNAAVTGDAVAGGGGGGGGGFVGVMTDTYTNTGTISALGGTGGTGAGTGAGNGVAGSAGRVSIMTPTGTTNL